MITDFFNKNNSQKCSSKADKLSIDSTNSDIDEEAIEVTSDCELTSLSHGDFDGEANEIHR